MSKEEKQNKILEMLKESFTIFDMDDEVIDELYIKVVVMYAIAKELKGKSE